MSDKAIILARRGEPLTGAPTGGLTSHDPFATGRITSFFDDSGLAAGVVRLDPGPIEVAMGHAEIIVVLTGAVRIDASGSRTRIGADEAVVLPRGFAGTIEVDAGTTFAFMAMTAAGVAGASTAPIKLDPTLPRSPAPGPAPEVVIGAAPSCHSCNLFSDASGMRAGVWDVTTPSARTFVPHRVHELMHPIEGAVTLTHQDGSSVSVPAGDTVFLPRGAPYSWRSVETVVKYYVVF